MNDFVRGYNPNRHSDWNYRGSKWKLSRSKIDLFLECARCFYVDNKLGSKRPSIPSFNLNIAVDELLKKEFDAYRKKQEPHPLMQQYGIDAVPFLHPNLEMWRDPFIGITYTDPTYKLTISGGVDDIWVTKNNELIIVDYKATSKEGKITTLNDSSWAEQYERQLAVYQWLLRKNDFVVSNTAYFVYCNGLKDRESFDSTLHFDITVISCEPKTNWIDTTITDIYHCLESDMYPTAGATCEYCAYRDAVGKKLQTIFRQHAK